VVQVYSSGLRDPNLFVPRLSAQAKSELNQLQAILSQVILSDARDKRRGPFCNLYCSRKTGLRRWPSSAVLFSNIKSAPAINQLPASSIFISQQISPATDHQPAERAIVWESCAPPRVKFFIWLMVHGRVQCRTNLCPQNHRGLPDL
jgi:hypothetical protein